MTNEELERTVLEQSQIIATMQDSISMCLEHLEILYAFQDRHQKHHEAVEELFDKPIERKVVEAMLMRIDKHDRESRKAAVEIKAKTLDLSVNDEQA